MNNQELIDKYEAAECVVNFVSGKTLLKTILRDLKQLDEQKPVKVPQVVADWIEVAKPVYSLSGGMKYGSPGVNKWLAIDDNQEIFARAWFDGYEVEKEKRYLVKFKGFNPSYIILKHHQYDKSWFLGGEQEYDFYRLHHTRKELEEADFGWVFDCPGIEIEEVE